MQIIIIPLKGLGDSCIVTFSFHGVWVNLFSRNLSMILLSSSSVIVFTFDYFWLLFFYWDYIW